MILISYVNDLGHSPATYVGELMTELIFWISLSKLLIVFRYVISHILMQSVLFEPIFRMSCLKNLKYYTVHRSRLLTSNNLKFSGHDQ